MMQLFVLLDGIPESFAAGIGIVFFIVLIIAAVGLTYLVNKITKGKNK
ncbi:MAG: hypothetical protein JST86_16940 [Bacteroidetes bacterium]|nr:hypothetical protein [Bacteroidota bacterium]